MWALVILFIILFAYILGRVQEKEKMFREFERYYITQKGKDALEDENQRRI